MRHVKDASPPWPPQDAALVVLDPDGGWLVYEAGDKLPDPPPDDGSDALRKQFEAEQQAAQEAEYAAFKARSGQPSYKAAAVKIAAEKLGMLDTIETAIMALVDTMGDKALYVWWNETDAISRGDANWQQIESAVPWGKVTAADVFDLAAQV